MPSPFRLKQVAQEGPGTTPHRRRGRGGFGRGVRAPAAPPFPPAHRHRALPRASAGDLARIVAANVIYSLGLSPVFTLTNDIILGTAAPERAGSASAISETSSELGGALGIAVLGSLGTAVYRSRASLEGLRGLSKDAADAAANTLGGAVTAAERLPVDVGTELLARAREAFTAALQLNVAVAALITLALAVVVARRLGGPRPGNARDTGPVA